MNGTKKTISNETLQKANTCIGMAAGLAGFALSALQIGLTLKAVADQRKSEKLAQTSAVDDQINDIAD